MREIKFRAWDKKHKKMAEVYTLGLTGVEYTTICTNGQLFSGCGKDDIELMQFTGLHDKNGKEIYEGDIVKCDEFRTYKVYWNKDRWGLNEINGFDYDNGDYYKGDDINNWKEFEVIGNIYENQELLEKTK